MRDDPSLDPFGERLAREVPAVGLRHDDRGHAARVRPEQRRKAGARRPSGERDRVERERAEFRVEFAGDRRDAAAAAQADISKRRGYGRSIPGILATARRGLDRDDLGKGRCAEQAGDVIRPERIEQDRDARHQPSSLA